MWLGADAPFSRDICADMSSASNGLLLCPANPSRFASELRPGKLSSKFASGISTASVLCSSWNSRNSRIRSAASAPSVVDDTCEDTLTPAGLDGPPSSALTTLKTAAWNAQNEKLVSYDNRNWKHTGSRGNKSFTQLTHAVSHSQLSLDAPENASLLERNFDELFQLICAQEKKVRIQVSRKLYVPGDDPNAKY